MAQDMTPQPQDTSVLLPITFDYKGGRGQNLKTKVILTLVIIVLTIILTIGIAKNEEMGLYLKLPLVFAVIYVGLFLLRFLVFKERHYSDIYEDLKAKDYNLVTTTFWQIFDIDTEYPYITYFKNGIKGIFVKMEKDAITGKSSEAQYDHFEAISDAYNIAHSLNMNIVHIDYMDNVGNDPRLERMYQELNDVTNPDMRDMLIDIYNNLQDEMSANYASFDIYLFLTRDKIQNFVYNVQAVANTMLGGNFITYKILNRLEIAGVCTALFNLHDFSLVDACDAVMNKQLSKGIIPIFVRHSDGTLDILNKTTEEKRIEAKERERKKQDQLAEMERRKQIAKQKKKGTYKEKEVTDEVIEFFNVDTSDDGVDIKFDNFDMKKEDSSNDSDQSDEINFL